MASITTPQPKRAPSGALLLATAITLVGVLLAGTWLLLHDRGVPAPATSPALQQSPAAAPTLGGQSTASVVMSDQEAYARWQAGRPAGAPPIYLAGSDEQADVLRQSIAEADAIRAALGAPPLTAAVFAISDGKREQVLDALRDADVIRAGLDLSATTVVDLRTFD